ncbi:MAG TPA: outer membrane beta-barrel protein [Saprospiraceae bacterium]|nr:outer membrane beta-barrel protein [Saprospiraceae bacterium]
MKVINLIWCLTITMPVLSYGQFSVRPKAGINYLWIGDRPKSFTTDGSEAGFQVGADLKLGGKFYFQPGFFLVRSGSTIRKFSDITTQLEGKATYFKIPANVGYALINTTLLKFRVHAGGVANKFWKVSDKSQLYADDYNPWYYGANVGMGIDVLLFTIDANYELGLTDYYKNLAGSKPTMFSVSVGLKF